MEPHLICAVSVHMLKGDGTMPHKESDAAAWISSWIEAWGNPIVQYVFVIVLNEKIAQDISQEAFWRLLKSRQQDANRIHKPTWLFSVARTLAMSQKQSLRTVIVEDDDANSSNISRVWQILEPADREVVWLFFYQRWPIKQIAIHVDQPIETVQTRLFLAKERLQSLGRNF